MQRKLIPFARMEHVEALVGRHVGQNCCPEQTKTIKTISVIATSKTKKQLMLAAFFLDHPAVHCLTCTFTS
jgi:hypothetical protein